MEGLLKTPYLQLETVELIKLRKLSTQRENIIVDLQKESEASAAKNEKLNSDIKNFERKNSELQRTNEALNNKLHIAEDKNKTLTNENTEFYHNLEELQDKLIRTEQAYLQLNKNKSKLDGEIKEIRIENKALHSTVNTLKYEDTQSKNKNSELQGKVGKLEIELKNGDTSLKNQNSELQGKIENLEAKLKNRDATLKNQNAELQEKVKKLENEATIRTNVLKCTIAGGAIGITCFGLISGAIGASLGIGIPIALVGGIAGCGAGNLIGNKVSGHRSDKALPITHIEIQNAVNLNNTSNPKERVGNTNKSSTSLNKKKAASLNDLADVNTENGKIITSRKSQTNAPQRNKNKLQ